MPLLENFPQTFFDHLTGNLGTLYAQQWQYDNQFCLVGDAAHAIVPFFGQGMNASFEDCEILMSFIDQNHKNWGNVFEKYSNQRKSDGHAIAKMAIENSKVPSDILTVFAGFHSEATNQVRKYCLPYPPSSPSIGLFKDGQLVHFIERHHIEGRSAEIIAENIKECFNDIC